MEEQIEGYRPGNATLEVNVGDHVFSAVVPAMVSPRSVDDYMVDGEVIADFELRIARWWCDHGELPGFALKFVRHALGLKQIELAELLGYQAETVSRWETGDRAVPRLVRVVLASMIGDRLAGDDGTLDRLRSAASLPSHAQRIELGRFQLRRPGAVLEPVSDDSGGMSVLG